MSCRLCTVHMDSLDRLPIANGFNVKSPEVFFQSPSTVDTPLYAPERICVVSSSHRNPRPKSSEISNNLSTPSKLLVLEIYVDKRLSLRFTMVPKTVFYRKVQLWVKKHTNIINHDWTSVSSILQHGSTHQSHPLWLYNELVCQTSVRTGSRTIQTLAQLMSSRWA